ncbi:MAG TPA: hypothetical protein VFQ05_08860 [Candidatus Eisenbacteria bacterium]|nr:hypothetical protein [Candidatus Eisenbacteria bacterium]
MQHARPNRLRRAVAYAALAAMLGLVALTLSQCTLVGDSLTGMELNGVGPTSCVKQCNDFYAIAYKREQKIHDTNNDICQALPMPQKAECLDNETARHEAAKAALAAGKTDCQNGCHRQGAGSAG